MTYTKQETAAINAAWSALEALCEVSIGDTTWLHDCLRLERAQAAPTQSQPVIWARARVVKCWHEGATQFTAPLHILAGWRKGAMLAAMLGVDHADKLENGTETRCRRHERALSRAPAAVAAYEAEWRRALDAIDAKQGEPA